MAGHRSVAAVPVYVVRPGRGNSQRLPDRRPVSEVMAGDALLRRVERTAMACCGAMAIAAFAIAGGSPGPSLAVLAGGLLIAISYWSIKSGVSNLGHAV